VASGARADKKKDSSLLPARSCVVGKERSHRYRHLGPLVFLFDGPCDLDNNKGDRLHYFLKHCALPVRLRLGASYYFITLIEGGTKMSEKLSHIVAFLNGYWEVNAPDEELTPVITNTHFNNRELFPINDPSDDAESIISEDSSELMLRFSDLTFVNDEQVEFSPEEIASSLKEHIEGFMGQIIPALKMWLPLLRHFPDAEKEKDDEVK
jgi:hypothetical protein